ncbi:MAG TPA: COX15/CtaA family protein [Burkholderiales bacterium]
MHISAASACTGVHNTPRFWLHRIATAAVVIVLLIVGSSAYLRQAALRFSCTDWPACTIRVAGEDPVAAQPAAARVVRLVHRISASVAGAAVLLIVFLSSVQRPRVRTDIVLSSALLLLTVFLAVLGRWSRQSQAPLVTLGNLLGGMALLTLLYWTRLRAAPTRAQPQGASPLAPVAAAALALAFADIAMGAVLSGSHLFGTGRDGMLALAHMGVGLFVLGLTGVLALRPAVPPGRRLAGIVAFTLAIAQAMTGWISATFDFPLGAALAHNLIAALLLIALATGAYRGASATGMQA